MGEEEEGGALVLKAGNRRSVMRVRVPRGGFDAAKRRRFIEVLAATCNVRLASAEAGVSHHSTYHARRRDAGFAAQWDEALANGYDRLETEALRYALERIPGGVDPHAQEAGGTDGETAHTVTGSAVTALVERRASDADLRFVLAILGRHARGVAGRGAIRVSPPSEADTDARLTALLDKLERQMAR